MQIVEALAQSRRLNVVWRGYGRLVDCVELVVCGEDEKELVGEVLDWGGEDRHTPTARVAVAAVPACASVDT